MAKALGHDEDARGYDELAASIKQAFQRKFVDETGRLTGDTQKSAAVAPAVTIPDKETGEPGI